MSQYEITCTNQTDSDHSKGRIISVGISGGTYSVEAVRKWIDEGDKFYVRGPAGLVQVYKYDVPSINLHTIRTAANGQWTDNLDALPKCPQP